MKLNEIQFGQVLRWMMHPSCRPTAVHVEGKAPPWVTAHANGVLYTIHPDQLEPALSINDLRIGMPIEVLYGGGWLAGTVETYSHSETSCGTEYLSVSVRIRPGHYVSASSFANLRNPAAAKSEQCPSDCYCREEAKAAAPAPKALAFEDLKPGMLVELCTWHGGSWIGATIISTSVTTRTNGTEHMACAKLNGGGHHFTRIRPEDMVRVRRPQPKPPGAGVIAKVANELAARSYLETPARLAFLSRVLKGEIPWEAP